jgi:hypothetical protein
MVVVFIIGMNVEVQHKRSGIPGEEPIKFFRTEVSPAITAGMKSYTVSISNDQKYTIESVSAEFRGPNLVAPMRDPVTHDDSVSAGGEISYSFDIPKGIESVEFELIGDSLPGLADINLHVRSINGSAKWSSESTSNDEIISLTSSDIESGGYGAYSIIVTHESGMRSVSYTLSISPTFGDIVHSQTHSTAIPPEETIKLDYLLNLDEAQVDEMRFHVTARIKLPDSMIMEILKVYRSDWSVEVELTQAPDELKDTEPWGPVDTTGTISAVAYSIAVLSGIVLWARLRFSEMVKPSFIGPVHCFISLISLILAVDHTAIALQKSWPWGSPGMLFAYLSIVTMLGFTIFSFYDVEGKKWLGKRKWRLVHLFLTILLFMVVILHVGLMGDHLGFLN